MRIICFILFTFFIFSCSNEKELEQSSENKINPEIDDSTEISPKLIDTIKSTPSNRIDKNGLKQGIWKTYAGNRLIKLENFKDGKLHGEVQKWTWQHVISYYKNGVIDSLNFTYFKYDSTLAYFIIEFNNGEKVWSGFPTLISKYGFPMKPFSLQKDTVDVSIPFKNGAIFYTGRFIKEKQKHSDEGFGIGIHKMYHMNGKLKAEYDFTNDKVKVYDINGKFLKEDAISPNIFDDLNSPPL